VSVFFSQGSPARDCLNSSQKDSRSPRDTLLFYGTPQFFAQRDPPGNKAEYLWLPPGYFVGKVPGGYLPPLEGEKHTVRKRLAGEPCGKKPPKIEKFRGRLKGVAKKIAGRYQQRFQKKPATI